jgi:hypothetical protein
VVDDRVQTARRRFEFSLTRRAKATVTLSLLLTTLSATASVRVTMLLPRIRTSLTATRSTSSLGTSPFPRSTVSFRSNPPSFSSPSRQPRCFGISSSRSHSIATPPRKPSPPVRHALSSCDFLDTLPLGVGRLFPRTLPSPFRQPVATEARRPWRILHLVSPRRLGPVLNPSRADRLLASFRSFLPLLPYPLASPVGRLRIPKPRHSSKLLNPPFPICHPLLAKQQLLLRPTTSPRLLPSLAHAARQPRSPRRAHLKRHQNRPLHDSPQTSFHSTISFQKPRRAHPGLTPFCQRLVPPARPLLLLPLLPPNLSHRQRDHLPPPNPLQR